MKTQTFVIPKGLPAEAASVFEKVYQANKDKGDASAAAIAWTAVKNGWKKEGEKWVKKTASELNTPHIFRGSVTDMQTMISSLDGKTTSDIEILKVGKWQHPIYGEFEITSERLKRFMQNFEANLRKGLPIDREHKSDDGAVGWINNLYLTANDTILMGTIDWTPEGIQDLKSKKYRYFSPEFADEYQDSATGQDYKDVLIGGGITNRPFFKELEEITLSEQAVATYKFVQLEGGEKNMKKCPECGKEIEEAKMKEHMGANHKKANEVSKDDLKKMFNENPNLTLEQAKEKGEVSEKTFNEVSKEVHDELKKAHENGKTITLTEYQFSELKKGVDAGNQAVKTLREMRVAELVNTYTYSESNSSGVILPANADAVKKFMLTLGDNQRLAFVEILKALPKIKLFGEIGKDIINKEDDPADTIHTRALKLMKEQPEKFKVYSDAAHEAEKVLIAEGKDRDAIQM